MLNLRELQVKIKFLTKLLAREDITDEQRDILFKKKREFENTLNGCG